MHRALFRIARLVMALVVAIHGMPNGDQAKFIALRLIVERALSKLSLTEPKIVHSI